MSRVIVCEMRRTLRFRCDVGWANMTPLPDGTRHCARCERPVHDLTRFTKREAARFRETHPDACVHVVARVDTQELVFRPEPRVRLPVAGAVVAAALSVSCVQQGPSQSTTAAAVERPVEQGSPALEPVTAGDSAPPCAAPRNDDALTQAEPVSRRAHEGAHRNEAPASEEPAARPDQAANAPSDQAPAPSNQAPTPPHGQGSYEVIDGGW